MKFCLAPLISPKSLLNSAILALVVITFTSFGCDAQTLMTLFHFSCHDGGLPEASLVVVGNDLYGTTVSGGNSCRFSAGVVFQFDLTSGLESVVHSFPNRNQGDEPNGVTLVENSFFGTTKLGGKNENGGTLFKLDPSDGSFKVLFNFSNEEQSGGGPNSTMIYQNGTLFGTTASGGHTYSGVVFKFDPKNKTESLLYDFSGGSDGGTPNYLTFHDGLLYGTAQGGGTGCIPTGCGVVFSMDPNTGAETILHTFTDQPDGAYPMGLMFQDGMIYGVTQGGGETGHGLLYRIDPATGAEKRLYSFHGGALPPSPNSVLVYHDGALYGTAGERHGYKNSCALNGAGCGAVFKYDIAHDKFTVLYRFTGKSDGGLPQGGLVYSKGFFYGTTELRGGRGCKFGCGTLFKLTP